MGKKTKTIAAGLPEKQKKKLYPVALDLFSTKDFHQVSIREICKLSGISTTTLYRYYPSKENLLISILDEKLCELADTVKLHVQGLESTKEMFRKLFWVTLNHYDQNPGLAVAVFITVPIRSWMEEGSYPRRDAYKVIFDIVEYGRKRNEIDPDITDDQIIDLYFMYCHRQIHRWWYQKRTRTLVDAIELFFNIFWKTVSVAPI